MPGSEEGSEPAESPELIEDSGIRELFQRTLLESFLEARDALLSVYSVGYRNQGPPEALFCLLNQRYPYTMDWSTLCKRNKSFVNTAQQYGVRPEVATWLLQKTEELYPELGVSDRERRDTLIEWLDKVIGELT